MNNIEFFEEMMRELGYTKVEIDQKLYPIPECVLGEIHNIDDDTTPH